MAHSQKGAAPGAGPRCLETFPGAWTYYCIISSSTWTILDRGVLAGDPAIRDRTCQDTPVQDAPGTSWYSICFHSIIDVFNVPGIDFQGLWKGHSMMIASHRTLISSVQ